MKKRTLSPVRHFLLWWFDTPASPWVSVSLTIDFTAALAYLAQLRAQPGPRVTIQHLLAGTVGRTLADFPQANARILGRRIYPRERVHIGTPVNLLGHAAGARRELSAAILSDVHARSLRQIAEEATATVQAEREDRIVNPLARVLTRLMEHTPGWGIRLGLRSMDRAVKHRVFAALLDQVMPITAGLTNPGAALDLPAGLLFRGGAISLPHRLLHVGTLWAASGLQDDVIPIDGVPVVRRTLPLMLVFDHRLIDGVRAGRMLERFHAILQDPAAVFGSDGLTAGSEAARGRTR